MAEWKWMVSFAVNEDGSFADYHVDQIDLTRYRPETAEKLRAQEGRGLFTSAQEAEEWAKAQTGRKSCGCSCGKNKGGSCGCPYKQG